MPQLTEMCDFFFVASLMFINLKVAVGTACQNQAMDLEDYKGRIFQDIVLNLTSSMKILETPSLYACRHICSTTSGCIAMSFIGDFTGHGKCKLYNATRVERHFIVQTNSTTILLLPIRCNKEAIVDGGWTAWNNISQCDTDCGGGLLQQERNCSDPKPDCNGEKCIGENVRRHPCQSAPCPAPIHGNWGAWVDDSSCSVTCGSGMKVQTRACDNPSPQNGGSQCSGNANQDAGCGESPCSTTAPTTTAEMQCVDVNTSCGDWANIGECSRNPGYMLYNCRKSCGQC